MKIAEKIFKLPSFQRQLASLTKESCRRTLSNIDDLEFPESIDWNNMISCASILCQSDEYDHQESALRVAQSCLENSNNNSEQKLAASVILDSLTNRPAIKLAIKRNLLPSNYEQDLPLPLIFDISKRQISHTILTGENLIYLNRFQKKAFDQLISKDIVSVSAPTSAGKSFLLGQTILQIIKESQATLNIVYIVPTRALITQVERDLKLLLKQNGLEEVFITSIPKLNNGEEQQTRIFVFTQERLHWLRVDNPSLPFDYVLIDEAQKISEGNRGILLQQKIEELVADFPSAKIFYSSALTKNPEILYQGIESAGSKVSVKTEFVAVNQNLLYVTQIPKNTQGWIIDLCRQQDKLRVGSINLPNRPTSDHKKLAFIAFVLGHSEGGNILYMNTPSLAERLANVMYDTVPEAESNKEIDDLIDFCAKTVHKDFLLNKVLKKRIAFHYGNMPPLIRQEIERLFEKGLIRYLICTSTLLEGVNLPARNIFLRRPTRGNGNPLKGSDFWNLAGRAGRLGKEFQGNIICIEPDTWDSLPSLNDRRQDIVKSIDKVSNEPEKIIKFLKEGSPRNTARKHSELDYAVTYYYASFLAGKLDLRVQNSSQEFQKDLNEELQKINDRIRIPENIIFRNPGISPLSMQALYDHFASEKDNVEKFIPDFPETHNAVENSYLRIVSLIGTHFSGDSQNMNYYFAILVVNWMRGYPLSLLISRSIEYFSKKAPNKSRDTIIRDSMRDVEEFARFKFVKYSACYIDILRYFLLNSGNDEIASRIPDLHIWLEFGVSQLTQVSLIALGLSRQTAISVSEFIAQDSLNEIEVKEWLQKNDLSTLQLSQIVLNEIETVLGIPIPRP